MSGTTFKCGIHRFDGHGNNSYRPKDSTCAQTSVNLALLKAERERQDTLWSNVVGAENKQQIQSQTHELPERTLPSLPNQVSTYQALPPWLVQKRPK